MGLTSGVPAARVTTQLILAAVGVGLTLSVVLLGATKSYGGVLGGEWWIPLFAATTILFGWISAHAIEGPLSLPVAAVLGPLAVGTMLVVKAVRWPEWPVVSPTGGLPLLLVFWALVGVAASLIPTNPPQNMRTLRGMFVATVLAAEIVGATLLVTLLSFVVGT